MLIVLVHQRPHIRGGADRAALAAAEALTQRGHRIRATFADGLEEADPGWAEAVGVDGSMSLLGPGVSQPGKTRSARAALAPLLAEGPDWVLVSEAYNPLLLPRLPAGTRLATWVHAHGETCPVSSRSLPDGRACRAPPGVACFRAGCVGLHPRRGLWPVLQRRALLRRLRIADRCLVASRYMRGLLEDLGVPEGILRLVPYPIPVPPATAPPPGGQPRALALGRLVPEKGLGALAEAAVRCGLLLDVVGDGPEFPRVKAAAEASGGHVRALGWLAGPPLEAAWAAASLLLVPSLWPEPFGMIGPEALRRGRPVLVTDVGGVRDWAHGEAVELVAPDPETLAARARAVLGDLAALASRTAAARAWTEPDHDPAVFGEVLEEALS